MSDSVENEWLCAQILGELGLQVANATIARFGFLAAGRHQRAREELLDLARTRKRLPRGFPPAVWHAVADGMRQHAQRFQRGD